MTQGSAFDGGGISPRGFAGDPHQPALGVLGNCSDDELSQASSLLLHAIQQQYGPDAQAVSASARSDLAG